MRVLLVEDQPDAARMIAKGLREQSYAVDVAVDGETMLALARTDAAEWPLTLSDSHFDELIAEVDRAVSLLADGRQSIEATCPPDLQFCGDEGLLRQMLLNLLDNSVRHTPPGGAVRVSAAPADGYLVLSVQDTGTGIPESARERIFDRFVRIDPIADAGGLGLGLAIARRIARARRRPHTRCDRTVRHHVRGPPAYGRPVIT